MSHQLKKLLLDKNVVTKCTKFIQELSDPIKSLVICRGLELPQKFLFINTIDFQIGLVKVLRENSCIITYNYSPTLSLAIAYIGPFYFHSIFVVVTKKAVLLFGISALCLLVSPFQ